MTDIERKAMEMALKFCEDIGDFQGPYPYVDQTTIVGDSRKVLQALRQALAQPEQEFVVWKDRLIKIHDALSNELGDTDSYIDEDMTDEEICYELPVFWAAKEIADLIGEAPWTNYTAPPKREWKGLTSDDKHFLLANAWNKEQAFDGFMDAIDKFLEEKNT